MLISKKKKARSLGRAFNANLYVVRINQYRRVCACAGPCLCVFFFAGGGCFCRGPGPKTASARGRGGGGAPTPKFSNFFLVAKNWDTCYHCDMKFTDGPRLFSLACAVIDRSGKRFCDTLDEEAKADSLSRVVFGELEIQFPDLELDTLVGWTTFKAKMKESKLDQWLDRIITNDFESAVEILEKKMMEYQDKDDKAGVDMCVKALAGLASKKKISGDGSSGESDRVVQIIISGKKGLKDENDTPVGS